VSTVKFTGRSEEDAVRKAAEELAIKETEVQYKIVSRSGGLLGLLGQVVTIEVTLGEREGKAKEPVRLTPPPLPPQGGQRPRRDERDDDDDDQPSPRPRREQARDEEEREVAPPEREAAPLDEDPAIARLRQLEMERERAAGREGGGEAGGLPPRGSDRDRGRDRGRGSERGRGDRDRGGDRGRPGDRDRGGDRGRGRDRERDRDRGGNRDRDRFGDRGRRPEHSEPHHERDGYDEEVETKVVDEEIFNQKLIKAQEVMGEVARLLGSEATCQVVRKEAEIHVTLLGQLPDWLGRGRNRTLEALQFIANKIVNRFPPRYRVVIFMEGQRDERLEQLEVAAGELAKKVLDTGEPAWLVPMSPKERRVVHMAVSAVPGLATKSVGDGPGRRLCIYKAPPRSEQSLSDEPGDDIGNVAPAGEAPLGDAPDTADEPEGTQLPPPEPGNER